MPKVVCVTGRIEIEIIGDRLRATIPSGDTGTTYAIPFHLAERAARDAMRMLGERTSARVVRLPRKGSPLPHG